jgi:shikimate dehydrogenase
MTWRLGVVGSPIRHSLTPVLHRAALNALGLSGESDIIEADAADDAFASAWAAHDALSVTMPLKEQLVAHCDVLDERARRVGAVNSLLRRNGRVEGRSTDGQGFLDLLEREFDLNVADRTVVVRGSGGSARSLVDALSTAGALRIALAARNAQTAATIAAQYPAVDVNPASVSNVALVVSTVPTIRGETREMPPLSLTYDDDAVAVDIQYVPAQSTWLGERKAEGLRTSNGLPMLVFQARHQMEWWFDTPVPVEPLLAAVGL